MLIDRELLEKTKKVKQTISSETNRTSRVYESGRSTSSMRSAIPSKKHRKHIKYWARDCSLPKKQ